MVPGEIYLAPFPFGDQPGWKLRPVLVLTSPIGSPAEVLVAYISSVLPAQMLPTDILLDPSIAEHEVTKLKNVSVVRLHKLTTIHQSAVARKMGVVSANVRAEVNNRLRVFLDL